jgi:hypothetical protein
MTNLEKIRRMNAEELARVLDEYVSCDFCIHSTDNSCDRTCEEGIVEWLNHKVNPMPEIKEGDIVDENNGLSYVAISPKMFVSRNERKQYNFQDIINRAIGIQRYDGDRYQTIWSVDNE